MISGLSIAVILLLVRDVWSSCNSSTSSSSGVSVNCSSQDLSRIPDIPLNTTELYLQHNLLLTVPPGRFDSFLKLRVVNLSENPFHCGCNIKYLRAWLLKNRDVNTASPTCSMPPSLAHRTITGLSVIEFSSCVRNHCSGTVYNLALAFLLCLVLGLLLWSLFLAKDLSFTLGIREKHSSLRAESLRSLKPKHRPKVKNTDLEMPLLDMAILPQIIDTLHKRHDIKLKEI